MRPVFATTYLRNRSPSDAVDCSYVRVLFFAAESAKYVYNIWLCKFSLVTGLASSRHKCPRSNSVVRIILSGAGIQVARIITQLVITFVKYTKPFRDRAMYGDERQSVCFDRFSMPFYMAVPVGEHCPRPNPAFGFCRFWMRHLANNVAVHGAEFLRAVFHRHPTPAVVTV